MSTVLATTDSPPTSLADIFGNLTHKQKSFADNYIEHRNGQLAAKLAGYDGDDNTLRAIASENLTKPNILAYIKARLEERHLTPDRVLAELGDVAAYSLDSIAVEGSPVKTQDKLKALELVGKFHKLFTDRVETDAQVNAGAVASEVVALLVALAERNRAAQAEQAQLAQLAQLPPAVVIETTARDMSLDQTVATPNSEDGP